ncbi:hypothetical protein GT347_04090 [Xylophilus rhododendri]|uniref:Uncharacterized protein n=1 Tax=Xylophilus rhododendri TaxID=2697032 RepID=A0A857J2V9_9BURK|nr:hypothetical protein [Xylophilus rhododendri]QHI97228.1 hypothetical protein GT347_04090 [Xylophilus rhododendri]
MLTLDRLPTSSPDQARRPIPSSPSESAGISPLTQYRAQHVLAQLPPASGTACKDDYSAASSTATGTPSVAELRIGRRWLTRQLRLVDEHAPHGLLATLERVRLLRFLLRLRYQDGWDDLASLLPLVLAKSRQPYVEIALLTGFLLFVLMSSSAAVRATIQGFWVDYPEAMDTLLRQQQHLIDSLLRAPDGVARDAGIAALRNLREGRKLQQQAPGPDDSPAAVEIRYQARLLQRLQDAATRADLKRKSALLSNAMLLMLGGMLVSIAKAMTGAILASAEEAGRTGQVGRLTPVEQRLQMAVPIVMATAQLLQAGSGAIGLRTHQLQHRQLRADLAAARQAFGEAPSQALDLYLQEQRFRARTAGFGQLWSGSLSLGQLMMLVANILFFLRPAVVLPLAIPGALLTLASSVLIGANEEREEDFDGAGAPRHLHTGPRNQGLQLHEQGLDATWQAGMADYLREQEWVVRSQLWSALLAMLEAKEDLLAPWPRCSARERRAAVARHIGRSQRRHLLPAGVERIAELLRQEYPIDFFDRPVRAIHQAIHTQMQAHPDAAAIQRHFDFRQEVFAATMDILSRRPEARCSALLQRVAAMPGDRLRADADFFDHLAQDPVADAIHLQVRNQRLAGHLARRSLARRADHHEMLSRLARLRGPARATSAHEVGDSAV